MRWAVLAVALAGCRYDGAGVVDGPAPGDGSATTADAAGDASPNLDGDGDGVVDADDNCPVVANTNQRDWDLDLHGDVCDRCPHVASPLDPDGDGDQVGDDCDPHPGVAGEAPAIWLGFYEPADIDGWVNTGGTGQWEVSGGLLRQSALGFSLLDSPSVYTDAYFEVGLTVTRPDTNEIGFCLGDVQPGLQYYCCGVSRVGAAPSARAASAWAGSGGQISVPGDFTGADLSVGANVAMTGLLDDATFSCSIKQGAITATPSTQTGDKVGTAVFYTTTPVHYRYAFVVTVP